MYLSGNNKIYHEIVDANEWLLNEFVMESRNYIACAGRQSDSLVRNFGAKMLTEAYYCFCENKIWHNWWLFVVMVFKLF